MPIRLNPVPLETQTVPAAADPAPPHESYARLGKDRAIRLARAMPDAQSAVLLLLAWQATLHERMKHGRLAGRAAASLSGPQLAELTGRPLRTIRHAIRRLTTANTISKEPAAAGRKNTYALPFLADHEAVDVTPQEGTP